MATMYRYGTVSTYKELTRVNMDRGLSYSTGALSYASSKGVNWSVAPGD